MTPRNIDGKDNRTGQPAAGFGVRAEHAFGKLWHEPLSKGLLSGLARAEAMSADEVRSLLVSGETIYTPFVKYDIAKQQRD